MSDFWSQFTKQAPSPTGDQGDMLYAIGHKQVLSITGPDASKFMQGQFTCNLNEINTEQYRRGAVCNAKGRMVASFDLAQYGDDFLMSTDTSLSPIALAHLKKYMVFFKCKMIEENYILAGLKGPNAQRLIEKHFAADNNSMTDDFAQLTLEHGIIIKLPFDAGYEIWLQAEHAQDTLNTLTSECLLTGNTPSTQQAWQANLIQAGLAQLDSNLNEALIPQMINLAQTGGVSFSKGCYTGQEIVARMQYLGKLKRHSYILKVDAQTPLTTGLDVYTPDHKSPIGSIVNVASLDDAQYVFAVLEDKYKDAPLCFGEGTEVTAATHMPLPYALTEEDTQT